MLSKLGGHVRDQWAGFTALVLVLCGGTALAVDGPNPGQNTVGSEDIIGNEVKSDDIGNGRIFNLDLADEIITGAKIKNGTVTGDEVDESTLNLSAGQAWTEVAPNPQNGTDPCAQGQVGIFCGDDALRWQNYGSGHETAGFYRDPSGVVHLKGTVSISDSTSTIFLLPVAYRPAKTRLFYAACQAEGDPKCRVDVHADGRVSRELGNDGNDYMALDGVSYRP